MIDAISITNDLRFRLNPEIIALDVKYNAIIYIAPTNPPLIIPFFLICLVLDILPNKMLIDEIIIIVVVIVASEIFVAEKIDEAINSVIALIIIEITLPFIICIILLVFFSSVWFFFAICMCIPPFF